jgi:hypothetical protein
MSDARNFLRGNPGAYRSWAGKKLPAGDETAGSKANDDDGTLGGGDE